MRLSGNIENDFEDVLRFVSEMIISEKIHHFFFHQKKDRTFTAQSTYEK